MFAQTLVGPGQNGGRIGIRAGMSDHECKRGFAPAIMGHTDHGHVAHRRMFADHLLEIARKDIEAAADDHVLLAIENRQEAVFVEPPDIARADEGAPALITPDEFRGFLGLAVIALHHAGAVTRDFADFAAWQRAASLIKDADFEAQHRCTDGVELRGRMPRLEHRRKAF